LNCRRIFIGRDDFKIRAKSRTMRSDINVNFSISYLLALFVCSHEYSHYTSLLEVKLSMTDNSEQRPDGA